MHVIGLFLYPLKKKKENHWFSDIYRGYRKRSVKWNRLMDIIFTWNIFLSSLSEPKTYNQKVDMLKAFLLVRTHWNFSKVLATMVGWQRKTFHLRSETYLGPWVFAELLKLFRHKCLTEYYIRLLDSPNRLKRLKSHWKHLESGC